MKCDRCNTTLRVGMFPFCKGNPEDHQFVVPGVIGDELNGYYAKHAVCWPDGTPRRFDSKTELKKALNEAGYTIGGDTLKPYKVGWSGRINGKPAEET